MNMQDFGLSAERGYLSSYEIDSVELPDGFDEMLDAAAQLSDILTTGRTRHWLKQIGHPDMAGVSCSRQRRQVRTAMVHYSFLVQAYVWGEPEAPTTLPANLAIPISAIGDHLGLPPLLPYSGYVLDNWYRLDKAGGISLDNIGMYQNFFGGQDENWFVLVHVAIEAEAGRALEIATELVAASDNGDAGETERLLAEMNAVWDRINAHFDRMPERCDPYIYFQRVRPYIHGWKNNPAMPDGLIYEGVAKYAGKPQAFAVKRDRRAQSSPQWTRCSRSSMKAIRYGSFSTSSTLTALSRTGDSSKRCSKRAICATLPKHKAAASRTRSTPASNRSPASAPAILNMQPAISTSRHRRTRAMTPMSAPAARHS